MIDAVLVDGVRSPPLWDRESQSCPSLISFPMPIPYLNSDGCLPDGIYDASLQEVEESFGRFQSSDRRVTLFHKLREYIRELALWGNVEEILLDGSFVTSKPDPGDIDLIVVLKHDFDFRSPTTPSEYNLLSRKRTLKMYGFHVFSVIADSGLYNKWVGYFRQDTSRPGLAKGLVRLRV